MCRVLSQSQFPLPPKDSDIVDYYVCVCMWNVRANSSHHHNWQTTSKPPFSLSLPLRLLPAAATLKSLLPAFITGRSHFFWSTRASIKPALASGQRITNSSVTEAQQQSAAALPALIYLQSSAIGTPVNPPSATALQLQKTIVMYNSVYTYWKQMESFPRILMKLLWWGGG